MINHFLLISIIIICFSCKNNNNKKNKESNTENIDTISDYRPAYHFTPDSNWINDANGLVYHDGEYHLFYQYNQFGTTWGHMSWGHSVSTDLMHWKTLPISLYEEKNRNDNDTSMIFSGSAVVDKNNSSGFGTTGTIPLVAIYTAFVHGGRNEKGDYIAKAQNQAIAYSNDKGRTWVKYDGNPVLDIKSLEFRDPKVFWYEPQQKWVMVVSKPDEHETWFYQSKDLKQWGLMSKWGKTGDTSHFWECPDLFELKVSNSSEKKWVMLSSSGNPQEGFYGGMQYFVGDFDGNKFIPVKNYTKPVYLDFGKDYYAAVIYNNAPDERKIAVGWMNNWEYAREIPTGNTWRGAFAIPRELSLIKSNGDYKLIQQPVKEYDALKKEVVSLNEQSVDSVFSLDFNGNVYELELEVEPGTAKTAGIKILKSKGEETLLKYDADSKQFMFDRTKSGNVSFNTKFPSVEKAPLTLKNGKFKLKILVDKCIVEVFINDGETTLTELVFPKSKEANIQLFAEGGKSVFRSIKIWSINPVKK